MATERITKRTHPDVVKLARFAFPSYRGRTYRLCVQGDIPRMKSYWSGGSRSKWRVVRLRDMAIVAIPENGSGYVPDLEIEGKLGKGYAIVEHSIFCGKDTGLRIYLAPQPALSECAS